MSETERRPGAAETSAAAADDARFTLLTTARDNAEGAFIESVLRGENTRISHARTRAKAGTAS